MSPFRVPRTAIAGLAWMPGSNVRGLKSFKYGQSGKRRPALELIQFDLTGWPPNPKEIVMDAILIVAGLLVMWWCDREIGRIWVPGVSKRRSS